MSDVDISLLFYKYLKTKNLLSTRHIRELEEEFIVFDQSNANHCQGFNFFQVVYALEYAEPPLLKVKNNGFVMFGKRIEERTKLFNVMKSTKNKEKLLKGNGSIEISCTSANCECDDGHFTFNLSEDVGYFAIVLKNVGATPVFLKKCLPLRDMDAFTFSDQIGCTQLNNEYCKQRIKAGESYHVNVQCRIKEKVGRFDTDLFFTFVVQNGSNETFRMLRFLTCVKVNKLMDDLKPKVKFTRREKIVNYRTSQRHRATPLKLTGDNLERGRLLRLYDVPRDLIIAMGKKVFTENPSQITTKERQYRTTLQDNLTIGNYSKKFSLLLYLEELEGQRNIRSYDMKKVTLERSRGGARLWLQVPGLAEKRPSVIVGDMVHLYELDASGDPTQTQVDATVHEVHKDKVLLGISDSYLRGFSETTPFDVVFTFSRFPIRIQHRSADLVVQTHKEILFPESSGSYDVASRQVTRYFNSKIENNAEQMKAVCSIVQGITQVPYVIYGPPGTGKTVTLVEAITQVVALNPHVHILVCSPSNSATDLLAERLLANVEGHKMFRMCANSREFENTSKNVQPLVNYNKANREYFFPSKEQLCEYHVILTTLITAGRLGSAKFPSDHFDYVFIDEAGYATEPEFMTAVAGILSKNGRVVMAGDPQQLGPVLYSKLAGLYGLGTSYLERISQLKIYQPNDNQEYDSRFITKLVKNYRSHRAILEIPNQCFYENELQECADPHERNLLCGWEKLPAPKFPLIFHSIKGKDLRESNSPSYFNIEEAVMVVDYVKELLSARGNGITPRDIGIISPYRKQSSKIRQALVKDARTASHVDKLKVGSVEEFQGQERRVIIISTVRSSNEHLKEDDKFRLGFLRNPKRFNVAITRAKSLLIVVGDPAILCLDHHWNKFINYCVDKGGFKGVPVNERVLRQEDFEEAEIEELLERMHVLELEELEEGVTADARRDE